MENELEMAVRRAEAAVADAEAGGRYDHCRDDGMFVEALQTADLRLILSANREMREALKKADLIAPALRRYSEASGVVKPLWDRFLAAVEDFRKARSALTTQRGDGE